MNQTPEFSGNSGDEAVETRIVAWVLGESSALESADLERLCKARPELPIFRRRIDALHQSLIQIESTAAEPAWALPPEKRKLLDNIFSENSIARTDAAKAVTNNRPSFRMFVAIAACLLLTALFLHLTSKVSLDQSTSVALQRDRNLMPATDKGAVDRTHEIYRVDSMAMSKTRDLGLEETMRQKQLSAKKLTNNSGETVATAPPTMPNLAATITRPSSEQQALGVSLGALSGSEMGPSSERTKSVTQWLASPSPLGTKSQRLSSAVAANPVASSGFRMTRNGSLNLEGHSRRTATINKDELEADRVATMAPVESGLDTGALQSSAKLSEESSASEDRYLTFPFNTGEASFQLAKAAMAQGIHPDPGTIRLEQFYNAVDYGDPAPAAGEPVAAIIEQSSHPFLPGTLLVRVALRFDVPRAAAENINVQVKFNPQRIGKYKLLGFEQKLLEGQPFSGAMMNTAEPTHDETGVAIYQVEPLAGGAGQVGEVSVSLRDKVTNEIAERTWTMSYQSQLTTFDRAAPSMQLAGLCLLAAEKLRKSPLAEIIDFNQLTGPISQVKQFYGSNPRIGEMLEIIDKLK